MENPKTNQSYKATILGLLLILFGAFYFAYQAGALNPMVWRVIFSWQMLLIALGILALSEKNYAWGTILIVTGGMFLYKRYTGQAIDYVWPIIIILAGLAIIFFKPAHWNRSRWNKENFKEGNTEGDFLNETAIFGGNERSIHSGNFKGGTVVSIFGGSKIDLTHCTLTTEGTPVIEMNAIFGGSTLIVPSDWNVKSEITSILGGFSDKRYHTNVDQSKLIIIKGVCIFGGGEVK
ncbi:MAG TPA: LiaF domain-containing protein [Lentimicrobium sp.]|nr:LiaF domain-containing protein [Lentimicrobium sp.]